MSGKADTPNIPILHVYLRLYIMLFLPFNDSFLHIGFCIYDQAYSRLMTSNTGVQHAEARSECILQSLELTRPSRLLVRDGWTASSLRHVSI
jgi:hypothetical protein